MNNIILIIFIIIVSSFSNLFSQNIYTTKDIIFNLDNSAVKRSTALQISSYSDKLIAKDIFDLDRTLFSGMYAPSFKNGMQNAAQLYFGIPIKDNEMYFGIGGAFSIDSQSMEYNREYIPVANRVILGKEKNLDTSFAFRPVFKINDMISIHYLLAKSGGYYLNQGYTYYHQTNANNYGNLTNNITNSQWYNEIAVAINFDNDMKLDLPIAFVVNNYSQNYTTNNSIKDTLSHQYINTSTNSFDNSVRLLFYPEFVMPLVAGPLQKLTFNLGLEFDLYKDNQNSFILNSTNISPNEIDKVINSGLANSNQNYNLNMSFDISAAPTLEWDIIDRVIKLTTEPRIGLRLNVTNLGKTYIMSNTYNSVNNTIDEGNLITTGDILHNAISIIPYLEIPIGTAIKPLDWFEIRGGIKYALDMNIYSLYRETAQKEVIKTLETDFVSKLGLYAGLGFSWKDRLFLDFFLDLAVTSKQESIWVNGVGLQLSYAFTKFDYLQKEEPPIYSYANGDINNDNMTDNNMPDDRLYN
ncbi:hypothetical protein [Brachyspira pilosicoli]|uniref:Uncharacterized protein n=1 Tax=Brachyspira pilosicoli TaxID=52584 RepID=A0A5C8EBR4_BRAPL|nr:hypothetical protein [Brachyspira pilosicoli]TXJ35216.1 hypothetical protein EPJ72_12700 [Brachyspira pilosicoli]